MPGRQDATLATSIMMSKSRAMTSPTPGCRTFTATAVPAFHSEDEPLMQTGYPAVSQLVALSVIGYLNRTMLAFTRLRKYPPSMEALGPSLRRASAQVV